MSSPSPIKNYDSEYHSTWVAFRNFSKENYLLIDLIRTFLTERLQPRVSTLIDVGCGNAQLTCDLLQGGAFQSVPDSLFLVEPNNSLKIQAISKTTKFLSSLGVKYSFIGSTLGNYHFPRTSLMKLPGLILVVHSSYYFLAPDFHRLAELKNKGFGVLIVENDLDCWVTCIMKRAGNIDHPSLNKARFDFMLKSLGVSQLDVLTKQLSVQLSLPSDVEMISMLNFFCGQVAYSKGKTELLESLKDAFKTVILDNPVFSYRMIYCPSQAD